MVILLKNRPSSIEYVYRRFKSAVMDQCVYSQEESIPPGLEESVLVKYMDNHPNENHMWTMSITSSTRHRPVMLI